MAGIIDKPAAGGAFASQSSTTTTTGQSTSQVGYVTSSDGGAFTGGYKTALTIEQLQFELADLIDIDVVSVEDNAILTYDETSDKWKAEPHTFTTVSSLNDVNDTNRVDGSVLTFDSSEDKYIATTTLEKQTIEGGSF